MKSLFLLFALAGSALAVDVDLPVFDSNKFCPVITGATNATPIRMTCAVAHNLTDNDKVHITGVYGNTAANGTFFVDVITATTFDLYSASGPTTAVAGSGTWSFGDGSGGGYPGGIQFAGKVVPVTLKAAHPRVMVDPDGNLIKFSASVGNGLLTSIVDSSNTATATYTRAHGLTTSDKICIYSASDTDLNCASASSFFSITAVPSSTTIEWTTASVSDATYNNSDLTISAWAQGNNPYWVRVNNSKSTNISLSTTGLPLFNVGMNLALNLGIICHVNRADTAACDAAKIHVLRPEVMGTNFGCDPAQISQGGLCNDGKGDYIGAYLKPYAYLYDLMEWNLSSPQKDTIAEKLFNDHLDGCTPKTRVTLTGTMSAPFPSGSYGTATSTLTGIGTAFTTELAVGDALVPPAGISTSYFDGNGDGSGYSMVTAITDDTHATITGHCVTGSAGRSCGSITPVTWAKIPTWSAGQCGAIWFTKHHGGTLFGQPFWHPPTGGTTLYGVSSMNNMVLNRTDGLILAATALAEVSAKARRTVSSYAGHFAAISWPMIQGWWAGENSEGSSYAYTRGKQEIVGIATALKYGYTGGPDITADLYFNESASFTRFMKGQSYNGTSDFNGLWAWGADGDRGFLNPGSQSYVYSWPENITMNPTGPEAGKTAFFFRALPLPNERIAGVPFFRSDPTVASVDYTSGPTQRIWYNVSRASCVATGYVTCAPAYSGYGTAISRKSWTGTSDTAVAMMFGSYVSDHSAARTGGYVINRGGSLMMMNDAVSGGASGGPNFPQKSNEMFPNGLTYNDGEYAYTHGIQSMRSNHVIAERWRGGLNNQDGNSDNKVAYWRVNLKNAWVSGVTTATRDMLHLKASGKQEYAVVFDHMVTATGRRIDSYHHWRKITGGLITCPSGDTTCTNVNSNRQIDANAASSTFPISSKVIAPTSSNIFLDVGASFPTGYTGGNGNTARLDICAGSGSCSTSATSIEYAIVTKIGTSVAATSLNPDANFFGFELTDWTILKARGTTLRTACPSVTSSATTNYMCIGLDAGTYEVRRNGSPVMGCTGVAVVAGDSTILCDDVPAGAITVVQTGAPADPILIATTTLPDGTQSSPYSQTLTISGGTPAYACTVVSGSLPASLSISVATISGTPSGTGMSSFTVSCTDSLMATPDTQALTITILPAGGAISITTTTLPDGVTGTPYSQPLTITGGVPPYACTVTVGSLPASLSISVATISGTPSVAGSSSFTVSCTDSLMATPDTQALSILIAEQAAAGTRVGGAARTGGGVRVQ